MSPAIDLRIDVSSAIGLPGPVNVAATIHLPEANQLAQAAGRPLVIFASPGGGYSRGYFDMHFEGRQGYSQAEYHTRRGMVFVAYDHVGVGDSSTQHNDVLTIENIADGNTAMVREVMERLVKGTAKQGFPALSNPFVVGIGQSMGGGVTMIMQSRHACFDAVSPLGKSALHTQLPQRTLEAARAARNAFVFTRATPPSDPNLRIDLTAAQVMDFVYPFHWEDVPKDVLDEDMKGGYPMRQTSPPFGSLTVPRCVVAMMSPAYIAPDAARIKVPVFIGVGERDVCPNPWLEPSAFWNSEDVSLFIVPRMAHMHNFAGTRERLWQRLHQWVQMVAGGVAEGVAEGSANAA